MTDTTADLRSEVISAGTPQSSSDYAIAPADQHIADAILAMDPVNDVPAPHKFPEGWAANVPLRLTMLPPPMQGEVRAKLDAIPVAQRAVKEPELTAAAIRSMRADIRVKTGVGPTATPYHREMVGIAREVRDLGAQYEQLTESLSAIDGYETVTDPTTGEPKPAPVFRVQGNRLKAVLAQQEDLLRQMRLLQNDGAYGIEGRRRLDQALHESVAARKAVAEQLADDAEAKRRTEQELREDRIAKRVRSMKRMRTTDG